MRKVDLQSLDDLMAAENAAAELLDLDDQAVDDFGLDYEPWEELACGVREFERDRHRWELDPASAEDFGERSRSVGSGPALKWRHFGH
jgi:hypothetical protein